MKQRRWMASMIAAAKKSDPKMPWAHRAPGRKLQHPAPRKEVATPLKASA
nr:hypothetical protein [uncultured Celeribacter sp.]